VPHFVLEYTSNIQQEASIPDLLRKVNAILMAQDGVFPTGGIRARAIELTQYEIADGKADDAFVHATLKIGSGRTPAQKKKVGDELFAMLEAHFADLFSKRFLALSMELNEFSEAGTWKHNNLHARFKKAPSVPIGANSEPEGNESPR
jgi:5-carboxymethyl-2-hydroxymuconate isomerase